MRRTFALLAAVAVAAGSGVSAPAPAAAQCAFAVVRHDRVYFLYEGPRHPHIRPGAPLGASLEPGCSDVPGVPAPAPAHVRARRIAGVSPDVAVVVRGQALVATGYLPQVSGFPLRGMGVDGTKGCRIGAPASLTGTARFSLLGIQIASGGRPVDIFLDARTRVTGLARHGLPYIGEGQRVRVDALHCGRRIVARRIVPAGRIVPETTAEDILGQNWRGQGTTTSARSHAWLAAGVAAVAATLVGGVLVLRRRPPGGGYRS